MEYSKEDLEQYTQQATKLLPEYDDYADANQAIEKAIDLIDKNIRIANKFLDFLGSNAQIEEYLKAKTADKFDCATGQRIPVRCEQYFIDAKSISRKHILAKQIIGEMTMAKGSLWGARLTLSYRYDEEF